MGTVKWTKEIDKWIKQHCPIFEYGYRNKANYERKKNDPVEKARRAAYAKQWFAKIKADPAKYEALLSKNREYKAKNRERANAQAREYRRKHYK